VNKEMIAMKHRSLLATYGTFTAVAALVTLGSFACTSETVVREAEDPDAAGSDASDTPDAEPRGDAGSRGDAATGGGTIGTRSDKGEKVVDVDFSSHGSYSCDSECKAAGGACKLGAGNGVGRVSRKYNDGSGTLSNQISSCSETESYFSGNTTMTDMVCFCSDMPAPPTVRVRKSEGLYACSKVCASWSLTCSTKRSHYGFADEEETKSTKLADCDAVPADTAHHYVCACEI
jgi:hypothetical protein